MFFYRSRLFKNFIYFFISFLIILIIFYVSLIELFQEFFSFKFSFKYQFTLYYFLFAISLLSIFTAWSLGVFRYIFLPIPFVINRIRNLKKDKGELHLIDNISELPDFWNQVEEELLLIEKDFQRKQKSPERIRKAIEQILNVFPEPVIVVSNNGQLRYQNLEFNKRFIKKKFQIDFISEIFREPELQSLVLTDSHDTIKKEISLVDGLNNEKKVYMVFKTPFATRNDDGSRDKIIIFHDITQIKKTDQMKTDFVSNVSHELRTPLTSIKGYLQTLKEDIQAKKFEHTDKFFEIIESHVDRLHLLIKDLLDLSYLESDVGLEKKPIDTEQLTQRILKQFSLDLTTGNYRVECSFKCAHVSGDERLCEQVLINLIQNSLRYTPPGTNIAISWVLDSDFCVLLFKDNGPGISEEHLSRIFERFYRIDPHRSRSRGGTGLGLSIVKHIMQRHGGRVEVESQLGYGVVFKCYFPISSQ